MILSPNNDLVIHYLRQIASGHATNNGTSKFSDDWMRTEGDGQKISDSLQIGSVMQPNQFNISILAFPQRDFHLHPSNTMSWTTTQDRTTSSSSPIEGWQISIHTAKRIYLVLLKFILRALWAILKREIFEWIWVFFKALTSQSLMFHYWRNIQNIAYSRAKRSSWIIAIRKKLTA